MACADTQTVLVVEYLCVVADLEGQREAPATGRVARAGTGAGGAGQVHVSTAPRPPSHILVVPPKEKIVVALRHPPSGKSNRFGPHA